MTLQRSIEEYERNIQSFFADTSRDIHPVFYEATTNADAYIPHPTCIHLIDSLSVPVYES